MLNIGKLFKRKKHVVMHVEKGYYTIDGSGSGYTWNKARALRLTWSEAAELRRILLQTGEPVALMEE